MYGGSEKLRATIATYPRGMEGNRLLRSLRQPEEENVWKIVRGKNMSPSDNVFLAHYKYDPWTKFACSKINSQLLTGNEIDEQKPYSNEEPGEESPIFIKVDPWFLGETELVVKGIYSRGTRSFLALQIVGFSYPMGPSIRVLHKNIDGQLIEGGEEEAVRGYVKVHTVTPPDEAVLADDLEPNTGGSIADIKNPEIIVKNPGRQITEGRDDPTEANDAPSWVSNEESDLFSTGEPQGSGGDTGLARINTPHVIESKGKVHDFWEALRYYRIAYPDRVKSVEWFSGSDFQSVEEYQLIPIEPFDAEDDVKTEVRNWVYIDARKKGRTRGALVIRVVVDDRTIYIVEMERRLTTKTDNEGKEIEEEEKMTGLIFSLKDNSLFVPYLQKVLWNIRVVKGVFRKILGDCPGYDDFFKHPKPVDGEYPGESSVKNALSKLDIYL
jgi:hypothetical protein